MSNSVVEPVSTYLYDENYWQLTVEYWPRAVAAGVRPIRVSAFTRETLEGPAYYQAHDIDFHQPPSRADFLQVVRQLPWMHVWEAKLLPVIAKNMWPMVDYMHKASNVNLLDEQGREVGRLSVYKQRKWLNAGYDRNPYVVGKEVQQAIRGLSGEKRDQAYALLDMYHENWLLERIVLQKLDTPAKRIALMKELLVEKGFLSGKPKKKTPA